MIGSILRLVVIGIFAVALQGGEKGAPPSPLGKVTKQPVAIVGNWVSSDGSVRLQIVSDTKLLYNGQPFKCRIDGSTIYVADQGQMVPYPYRVSGDYLELTYPEGYAVLFVKEGAAAAAGGAPQQAYPGQGYPQRGYPQGGGSRQQYGGAENALLQGRYCSYSSSGGYGSSSYSSSNWAAFDGRGNFTYGSGGYYSGGGDLYGSEGADGRGTYEVRGNTIVLRYPDGSSDQAFVFYRGAGGRITEVNYGDTLYAPQLCE